MANRFLVNAFQGGTSTVLWALSHLAEQSILSRSNKSYPSFYFCPSIRFYKSPQDFETKKRYAEVDFLAVVDGDLVAAEVKRSVPSAGELKRFIEAVNVLRPNIALLAIGEKPTLAKEASLQKEVFAQLAVGIKLQIISRIPKKDEWWLP